MKTIIRLVKWLLSLLFAGLQAGINAIRKVAPKVMDPYLDALERFTQIAIGVPTAFMVGGFLLYWVSKVWTLASWLSWMKFMDVSEPLWRISVLLGGVSALVLGSLFGILLSPPGILVSATMVSPQNAAALRKSLKDLPWYAWLSPVGIFRELRDLGAGFMQTLREAIERYVRTVRTVLVVIGFGFFFFAILPEPVVTLLLLCIVGVWAVWLNQAYSTVWSKLMQAGAVTAMSIYYAYVFITGHTFIARYFPRVSVDEVVLNKKAEALTSVDVRTFISANWVWFVIAVAVLLLLTCLLIKMFRKTSASAGNDHHPVASVSSHTGGGKGSGWLATAAIGAFLLLCVALIVRILIGAHEERSARIEREIQVARANHEARAAIHAVQSAALAAQAQQRQAAQQAAATQQAPTQERRSRLINSTKYPITLSTNLGERISRPFGFSTRMEPPGLPYELWTNGVFAARGPRTKLESVTYVQYRWMNPIPTNVVVEVGEEVK